MYNKAKIMGMLLIVYIIIAVVVLLIATWIELIYITSVWVD